MGLILGRTFFFFKVSFMLGVEPNVWVELMALRS